MTSRDDVVKLYGHHVSQATARLAEHTGLPVEAHSDGARVWDDTGRSYLDCGGYGVFLLGHRHPTVVAALHAQLDRNPLATRGLLSAELATASARLAGIAPPGLDYVYLANTGAEAVETALKLARAGGRRRIISMRGGFHGKTLGALSITDRPVFQQPFRPLLPDVSVIPYGDVAALTSALDEDPAPACVVVEPVQGEGGVRIPPAGYLAAVAAACRDAGAFLVVDEIQTGTGRLGGSWWGCDREGVTPDLLLAGKSLGGGCMPVSAVIGTADAFRPLNRNARIHSSTFAGSPLAAVAVSTTLDVIERDGLLARTEALGGALLSGFQAAPRPAAVRDIRGRGLLLGVELTSPAAANSLLTALRARGVLAAATLSADLVVRLSPPAVLTDAEAEEVIAAFRDSLADLPA
ncbi:MAG TPA: aminotransferase class III-fold pyridoxal phosphate-dependent enzyme [Streptosporangiaceae bacterium]|nr:aminotransferase class III-fold pyridoxal phosphate-dependent enzyme [Streptosporangiaceae bacterium]